MKRMIFAILIISTMLLVSGCAQNGDVAEEEMDDVVVDGTADADENLGNTVDDSIPDDAAEIIPEDEGTPTEPDNTTPISQEELDKLKEELEGLEFEDLGGLSEE